MKDAIIITSVTEFARPRFRGGFFMWEIQCVTSDCDSGQANENAAGHRAGKSRRHPVKNAPAHWVSSPPLNTWVPRANPVYTTNGNSIGSAFCRAHGRVRQTHRQIHRPRYGPHLASAAMRPNNNYIWTTSAYWAHSMGP